MADFTLNVLKFDPSVDDAPYYKEYSITLPDDGTGIYSGLQALKHVNENIESIAFDSCCYSGGCGRCAMMIDGIPCLACYTLLIPGMHTFEPLRGFAVTRDLIVEKGPIYDRFVASVLENQTVDPIKDMKPFPHTFYWDVLDRLNMCRECGLCYAACPALQERGQGEEFIGPGAMMQIGFRYLDGRDQSDRIMQAVTSGLFQCDLCGECSAVCSSRIDIVGIMYGMQEVARQRGIVPANAVQANFGIPASGLPPLAGGSTSPEEMIADETCSMSTCHNATTMEWFKERDEAQATLRVESHVKKKATVTEEQAASLIEYFMRSQ